MEKPRGCGAWRRTARAHLLEADERRQDDEVDDEGEERVELHVEEAVGDEHEVDDEEDRQELEVGEGHWLLEPVVNLRAQVAEA